MSRKLLSVLALSLLVSAPATQRRGAGSDDVAVVFPRWFRDFKAGKIEPGDVWGPQSKPYLPGAAAQGRGQGRGGGRSRQPTFSRLHEARVLFMRMVRRGTEKSGEQLLSVIEVSLKKKGGKLWERNGRFSVFRQAAIDAMARRSCPEPIQGVIVARLRDGLRGGAPRARGEGPADIEADPEAKRRHERPELATALIPLVAGFRQPAHRHLLEECLLVDHSGVKVAAAQAISDLGFGPSLPAVARALRAAKYPDDAARLSSAIARLVRARNPAPTERDLKFTINLALDSLDKASDWRTRIALVRVLRTIRSRGNIPALIALLQKVGGGREASPRGTSGTLIAEVHEALVDLAGYWVADARSPEKWQGWWDSVKDSFVLPEPKSEKRGPGPKTTVASTFFGIPVTGNRVVFVFDISGSMAWPFEAVTVGGGGGRGPGAGPGGMRPPPGDYETKLDRSRKELMKAVSGMTADSKLNVVCFNDRVSTWKDRLVWANAKNRKALETYVAGLRANGGTALYDGMQRAMSIKLDKRRSEPYGSYVDEIFILSDGAPTVGEIQDPNQILRLVTDWNRGAQVRIHAIYIGGTDDGRGGRRGGGGGGGRGGGAAAFMKRLAEQNDGKFVMPGRE